MSPHHDTLRTAGDAKRAELIMLSTLHRVSVAPALPKLREAELDARIADRVLPERPMVERFSRGLGEKNPNPRAWWVSAEAAAANEEWIREQFRDAPPTWPSGPTLAIVAIGLVAFIGLAVGWLG